MATTSEPAPGAALPPLGPVARAIGENTAEVVDAYWRRVCANPGIPEDARLALAVAFQTEWMRRVAEQAREVRASGAPNPLAAALGIKPGDIKADGVQKLLDRLPALVAAFKQGWDDAQAKR